MEHKNEYLNITFCKWCKHKLDHIEKHITANWLEQEQVQQTVHDVFDAHDSLLFLIIFFGVDHFSMVVLKSWNHLLQDIREKGCTAQSV